MHNPIETGGRVAHCSHWLVVVFGLWLTVLCPSAHAQDNLDPVAQAAAELPTRMVVSTKPFKPFVFESNGEWTGFSLELWSEVANRLDVEYELLHTTSVGDLLDTVRDESADIAVAGLSITSAREQSVDFTHAFYESGLQILVKNDGSSGVFGALSSLLPAVGKAFGLLAILIFCVGNLVWFLERKTNPDMFSPRYFSGIWDGFWWAAVTLTTVGYGDHIPKSRGGRVVALFWMFSGILVISYFTATVTSTMTIQHFESSISSTDDLAGRLVGTTQGSTTADWLVTIAARVVPFDTIEEAYIALDEGTIEAVVYDSPVLMYYSSHEGAGSTHVVGPVFQRQPYGFALQEGSELREGINQALLSIREDGTYQTLYTRWFGG
ncbi:MAG: ABC-type amino acid transport substrate-binding protein [Myxococcota bacterium]|jgi:ABC-type amino acid transport substrate-binding protein